VKAVSSTAASAAVSAESCSRAGWISVIFAIAALKLLKDTELIPDVGSNVVVARGAFDADEQALNPNAATAVNSANDFFMSLLGGTHGKNPWWHMHRLLVRHK
jgi:hypothetical protein